MCLSSLRRSLWTFQRYMEDLNGQGEPLLTSLDHQRWDKEGMLIRLVHVMTGRFLCLPETVSSQILYI